MCNVSRFIRMATTGGKSDGSSVGDDVDHSKIFSQIMAHRLQSNSMHNTEHSQGIDERELYTELCRVMGPFDERLYRSVAQMLFAGLDPSTVPLDTITSRLLPVLKRCFAAASDWRYLKGGPEPAWVNISQGLTQKMGAQGVYDFLCHLHDVGATTTAIAEIEDLQTRIAKAEKELAQVQTAHTNAKEKRQAKDREKDRLRKEIEAVKISAKEVRDRKASVKQQLVDRNMTARDYEKKGILTPVEQSLQDYENAIQRLAAERQQHTQLLSRRKLDRSNNFMRASEDAVRQEEAKARLELLEEENLILQRKIRECTIECDKLESEMETKRPYRESNKAIRVKCKELEASIGKDNEEIHRLTRERDQVSRANAKLRAKIDGYGNVSAATLELKELHSDYANAKKELGALTTQLAEEDANVRRLQRMVEIEEAKNLEGEHKVNRSAQLVKRRSGYPDSAP
eukprot:m.1036070 g.1036070  ORF g.1036070 m.1036070 type:complete len:457 (-) comp24139_c2_seq4:80-1450(-)